MASILANSASDDIISFFLLDGGVTKEGKQQLASLKTIHNFEIEYIVPQLKEKLEGCPDISYYSMNAYSRLLLPELLPDVDRILYLDCDMVVDGSLADLWNTDLEGRSLGVAIDTDHIVRKASRYYRRLNLIGNWSFNSGMLLMDLKRIREKKLFQKTISWIAANRQSLKCPDQDGLNVLFKDDKKKVSVRYNFIHKWNFAAHLSIKTIQRIRKLNHDFADSMEHPVIIHFIGTNKPTDYAFTGTGDLYWKYLALTPWRNNKQGMAKSFYARLLKWYKCFPLVKAFRRWLKVRLLTSKQID